jgi:hypothetical protein
MSPATEWPSLVRDSLAVVLRRLSTLPLTPETEQLGLEVSDCLQQAKGWELSPPSVEHREALMKRVLAIHTAVARLERQLASID